MDTRLYCVGDEASGSSSFSNIRILHNRFILVALVSSALKDSSQVP